MLNTCSIGRRWKPREGWSRPVLTGERGTLFPIPLFGGRVSSCGGFFRWMARNAVSCGHGTIPVKRFCSRPLSGSRTATIGIVAWFRFCRPILVVGRCIGFAVVMAQVRRPVPFRTRKLRPGRGDGTALERVWESSTPPHSTLGVPVERHAPGTPFFFVCLPVSGGSPGATLREPPFLIPAHGCFLRPLEVFGRRKDCRRDDSSIGWRFRDAGRPVGGMIPPPTGCFVPPEGPWAGGFLHPLGVPGRWGIPGIPGELPALIRWWNRLGNYALFRTQTLRRIEQNHVSRQSDGPAGRRPELA